jgi:hypothetical protein
VKGSKIMAKEKEIFFFEGSLRDWNEMSGNEYECLKNENGLPRKQLAYGGLKGPEEAYTLLRQSASAKKNQWAGFVHVTITPVSKLPPDDTRDSCHLGGYRVTGYPVKLVEDGEGFEAANS